MEGPVLVEVAVADQGTELEDGLGPGEPPSCACYGHSVLDQVPACSFDDPGGDRPAPGQRGGVIQEGCLGGQVGGALVGAGPLSRRVAEQGGAAPDPGGDLPGLAVQDLGGIGGYPFLGGGVAFVKERPG